MLEIEIEERDNTVVICITGVLSMGTVDEFDHAFKKFVNSKLDAVALDLRNMAFLDSFGMNRIIKVSRLFAGSGTGFVLINMNDAIRNTFAITTFDKLFTIMSGDEFNRKYFPPE